MRYRFGKRAVCGILLSLCILLLWGCSQTKPEQATAPTVPTEPQYTVKFMVDGEVHSQLVVKAGGFTAAADPSVEGLRFYGWQDESGTPVKPETVKIHSDTVFYARLYADLSSHVPYLFADANNFLRPEDALTADELAVAVTVLAVDGAEDYLPELPEGAEAVIREQVINLLQQLFPSESVEQVMAEHAGETVSRGAFAEILNALLQRNETAAVVEETVVIPLDLSMSHASYPALLEASLHHTHGDGAIAWQQVAVAHKTPAGFRNIEGWLYYVAEDGAIVRDTKVGELTFDAAGRYTSGDAELDGIVAQLLAQILTDNPDAERIDLLRRAFEYSRDNFSYLRRSSYYFGQTGWEIEDAKKMFTTGRGNCYSYAAVFWALARGLGYEAIAISGTMTGTDQPHSWVEIFFEGTPYIFDPEMEMVYRTERDIFDKDMFMVTYAKGTYWNYKRP